MIFRQSDLDSNQASPSSLYDRQNKIFLCFCEKVFTTYPGLYLHLKSKHVDVFPKYKKLKIPKLLKKSIRQNGKQLHQLPNIFEKDNSSKQKKNLEKKRLAAQQQKKALLHKQFLANKTKKSGMSETKTTKIQEPETTNIYQKKDSKEPAYNPNFSYPFANPYFGFPPPPMPHFYPPPPPTPTPPPPSMYRRPPLRIAQYQEYRSTKYFLQKYIFKTKDIENKLQLKQVFYDLMSYIDKNTDRIPDLIPEEKLVLCLCDWLEAKDVMHLISSFIEQEQQLLQGSQEEEKLAKLRKIGYVIKFTKWLKEIGEIDESLPNMPINLEAQPQPPQEVQPVQQSQSIILLDGVNTDHVQQQG